ncbi:MAG: FtsX-like permease family protein, partial [bacterium]|nr:FtsX-like permease family protein [bacterium]
GGLLSDETPSIRRTCLQRARDMWRPNDSRIRFFGSHGIDNARVTRLHDLAGTALEKAETALAEKDYQQHFTEARRALSLESRAYPDVVGMANDTVRGLLFYLALLLPFAFTMERLFVAGRRIETRIAGVALFFIGMFFALRFTHPAFQIVLSPMVVLLGFVISVLSSAIISIVMGKLETLVSRQKVEQMGEHESGVQAVSGFALALEMGIANMRRRKARTILTSITLVVLTFSVLSFASVTAQIRLQQYDYSEGATPYDGILLRTKNWAPFPFETFASLRNELEDTCVLAPRRWYYGHLTLNQSSIDIQLGSTIRTLRALIGLTSQEQRLTDVKSSLLGNSRWLSEEVPGEDPIDEILVPVSLAAELTGYESEEPESEGGLTEAEKATIADGFLGKRLNLLGREFDVVGVFDWGRMNEMVDIDGEPLTPFDPVEMEKKYQEEGVADPEEVQRYIHHSFKDVAIVSERMLGNLGGDVRSLAMLPLAPDDLDPLARSLVRRLDYILFVNKDGVPTLMSSRDATGISDLWNLIVLMLIAGLIVFNTMLGSVFERTGEIGTYTALGIAPSHIGRLFLVEAGVFAILGTMAGYVLGQSVSWCVHELDVPMLSALDLNYSSLAGVGACVLVIMMTLASAYYPSRKATEIGVPDIERRWRLPKTKEPRITLDLPFTVSLLEAQGLV